MKVSYPYLYHQKMDEAVFQQMAAQLRKPEGEQGIKIAEKMNLSNALINQFTMELLHPAPHHKILEIGMGNGQFVKDILAKDLTITYTGCDFSMDMVNEAKKRNLNSVSGKRADFYFADAQTLPFPDTSFDIIFTVNTIYFWADTGQTLAEIKRVLKPGGRLLISARPKPTMEAYPFAKYGFTLYDAATLRELLTRNGFRVTQILEKDEPEQEINDRKFKVASLIVSAEKNNAS